MEHEQEPGREHASQDSDAHGKSADVVVERPLGQPRKFFEVGGVRFALIDEGSGPAVVLLHGFPTSCALWRHVVADLAARGFRCVAPDLLGFGDTACPVESAFGLDRQAELVLALVDALGIDGEVALVGHDWGGVVAQFIAATAPSRVSRLVLVDCPAFEQRTPAVVTFLRRAARFSVVFDLLCETGFLRWFAASRLGFPAGACERSALPAEAVREYLRPLYRDTPPAYRAGREAMRRAILEVEPELDELLGAIAGGLRRFERPTLVVWGCDDPYISVSWGKKLADEIPGCVGFELIPFCGHFVPEEKPGVLSRLVAAHLAAPPTPAPPSVAAAGAGAVAAG